MKEGGKQKGFSQAGNARKKTVAGCIELFQHERHESPSYIK